MELSISLAYPLIKRGSKERRDFAEAAKITKDAGFHLVDYTPGLGYDGWQENAKKEQEILQKTGVSVWQMHAPFFRERPDHDMVLYRKLLHNTMESAVIFHAPYVVVHADEYRVTDHYDVPEILEYAYDYLAPEVEFAKKNGFKIALENLFEEGAKTNNVINGCSRFTARIDELQGIIERFADPTVCCCWDTGHAKLAFGMEGQFDALRQVGKYVQVTHVHDNYIKNFQDKDLHLRPFLGDIDWETYMRTFREIGYQGNLSFELGYGTMADALLPMEMESVYKTGQYLISLFA